MHRSTMNPIYEPEFAFLPFACDDCGGRFFTAEDVATHKRETCHRDVHAPGASSERRDALGLSDAFQLPDSAGVADGGRKM